MNEPLWLPKGSVHALLTFLVVGIAGWMVTQGQEVPEWWQLLTGGALGGYSLYRHVSPAKPPPPSDPVDLERHNLLRGTYG